MLRYLARRLVHSVVVLVVLVTIIFFAVNAVGDPARLMLPPEAPDSLYQATRAQLGLDQPLLLRYLQFMGGLLTGDLGESVWQKVPALPLVLQRVPGTLLLTAVSLLIAIPLAIALGCLAALGRGTWRDRMFSTIALAGVSVAEFWLGLMLVLAFGIGLHLLPTSGYAGLHYALLPAIALAARPMGRLGQVTRASVLEELEKPYIVALRAKGMPERTVVLRHALPNAAISVITIAGDELVTFLNGAVVIETIFAWPGIGSLFIEAIERRDLQLIIACVLVIAVLVLLVNLAVDLLYARLDPRVSLTRRRSTRLRRLRNRAADTPTRTPEGVPA